MTMRSYPPANPRWLFIPRLKCYAIGDVRLGAWQCHIPMCYASKEALELAKDQIREDMFVITLFVSGDERTPVIQGNPVSIEIEQPRGLTLGAVPYGASVWEAEVIEPTAGKITINGQVVYGMTPYGPVWTPVRPDMGDNDLYWKSALTGAS
jgi:hypothetical protein